MKRFPDWPRRLLEAIAARVDRPYQWGDHDCCLAAADLIAAMTGEDPAAGMRTYRTARGASLVLGRLAPSGTPREARLEAVAEIQAAAWGFAPIPVLRAGRGDAVVVRTETPTGPADLVAIVDMTGRHVIAPAAIGWAVLPLRAARRAWKVA